MDFANVSYDTVGRSLIPLSCEVKGTVDFGKLIPLKHIEVLPGDSFRISVSAVVRALPMIVPVVDNLRASIQAFYVPNTLAFGPVYNTAPYNADWKVFITGSYHGKPVAMLPTLPRWIKVETEQKAIEKYSLWDYFGLGINPNFDTETFLQHDAINPLAFPKIAYNMVWNEYYRDENLEDEIDLWNDVPLRVAYRSDYFNRALPFPLKGAEPSLLIGNFTVDENLLTDLIDARGNTITTGSLGVNHDPNRPGGSAFADTFLVDGSETQYGQPTYVTLKNVLRSYASTLVNGQSSISPTDIRFGFSLSHMLERQAAFGTRYGEWIKGVFNVENAEAGDRPYYIGGYEFPILVSEVLQTSQTTQGQDGSPQGNLAGHGIGGLNQTLGSFTARDHGTIIILMSIAPEPSYIPQGIPKSLLKKTPLEFYNPFFANISEQPVYTAELYLPADLDRNKVFGYRGAHDDYRFMYDVAVADMRDTFKYWHCAQDYDKEPLLNGGLIRVNPHYQPINRIFAYEAGDTFIYHVGITAKAFRPMPARSVPGLDKF